MTRPSCIIAVVVLVMLTAACGRSEAVSKSAQEAAMATPHHSPEALSLARVQPRNPAATLELLSDAVGADGAIDLRHTAYGRNLSPPLRWTAVEGAGAYAIILEDPDAPREKPFVHWMIWNIPGQATSLPEGLPDNAVLVSPQHTVQGRNDTGSLGYYGPHPPAGTGVHHYHFQIFALDAPLTLGPQHADLRALVDALKGRTLADSEMVATFAAPRSQ